MGDWDRFDAEWSEEGRGRLLPGWWIVPGAIVGAMGLALFAWVIL